MGRRQNPAIEAYFERGQKLDDASNRYQQTCRKCGEFVGPQKPCFDFKIATDHFIV